MKIVVENIFMCLVLFWKCYFPTNFSHFLGYFLSIQTNFITKNFKITTKSQHHTPLKLQFNPRQQTPAIKSHNHQNTTTTPPQQQQKSKSQREIGGSKIGGSKVRSRGGEIEGEIERHGVIGAVLRSALCAVRSARSGACNRWIGARGSLATSNWWSGLPLARSLSLSLSARLTQKWFEVKIWASNHFCGQRLILHGQLQITSGKFIFHAQPNTRIYGKAFSEVVWSQNKHNLKCISPMNWKKFL